MKELIVISGKGGTGKTSITASFAMLAERPVVARLRCGCGRSASGACPKPPRTPRFHERSSGGHHGGGVLQLWRLCAALSLRRHPGSYDARWHRNLPD